MTDEEERRRRDVEMEIEKARKAADEAEVFRRLREAEEERRRSEDDEDPRK